MEKTGIKLETILWTVGQYDLVHVFQAPSDEAAATVAYTLSAFGNVRTNTMRAFTASEIEKIVANVQTPYDLADN
jgi:uncharacterized protein with GYD domain